MLKGISPREYQINIAQSVIKNGNTLVVLPTGLGKTLIALLVMDRVLEAGGRVLFLAPTKPLVHQHYLTILKHLDIEKAEVVLITGEITQKKRPPLWKKRVIVCTPQTVKNDIQKGIFDATVSLCIIDEAHRTVGNYAYTYVAERCNKQGALILGLTASPGGRKARIDEIMKKLFIKNVEIRNEADADVQPYVKTVRIKWRFVRLPEEMRRIDKALKDMLKPYCKTLSVLGLPMRKPSKGNLARLHARLSRTKGGARFGLMSAYAAAFNLVHMIELLETQGPGPFIRYIEKIEKESKSKGVKNLLKKISSISAKETLAGIVHPKMYELLKLVKARKGKTMIIFAQYRAQIDDIVDMLNTNGIVAKRFVGKRKGLSQKEQQAVIEDFRKGRFKVIVATSIGEEGLDIPSVDTVIFYEPIPSEIRTIQRRGRAGRAKAGEVIVLITRETQDEAFYWASRSRERKMHRYVKSMGENTCARYTAPSAEQKRKEAVGKTTKESKNTKMRNNRTAVKMAAKNSLPKNSTPKKIKKRMIKRKHIQKKISEFF